MTFSRLVDLPGVEQSVKDARDAMDLLRKQRILRTKGAEVRILALSESARAESELGNIEISIAVALLESSISSASSIANSPMQALAQFHSTVSADSEVTQRGRPRELSTEESQRLFALNDLLNSDAPALIVAALAMAEIMDIAPFSSSNETVARMAFRSILIGRGFDPDALGLPEVGMLALGATSFIPALAAYRAGTPEGVASWLRHIASAVQYGARRGIEICDGLSS